MISSKHFANVALIMFLLCYYVTLYNLLSEQLSQNILKMLQLKHFFLVYI